MNLRTEKRLHLTFEVTILLKAAHAMLEIVVGALLLLSSKATLLSLVRAVTADELGEDPTDGVAHYLLKTAHELSVSGQHFISLYLLTHGIIKLCIIVGLLQKRAWAYPVSIVVFSVFIAYQLYRYSITGSLWLLIFSLFDLTIILLTLHEYNTIREENSLRT